MLQVPRSRCRRAERKLRLDNARMRRAPAASGSAAIVAGKLMRANGSSGSPRRTWTNGCRRPRAARRSRPPKWASSRPGSKEGPNIKGTGRSAPRRPPLPAVKNAGWCRTPIDRFILARLEAEGHKPSPEADKGTFDSAAQPRRGRAAAGDSASRRLSSGWSCRGLRQAGRTAARVAALWQAPGANLARCRAVCRLRRIRRISRS